MNLLDLDNEKFKNVEIKGLKFRIRAMFPLDKIKVAQRRMKLQDGQAIEAMTNADFMFFENVAMVDVCTEEMPKDFKTHESCINWIDGELINLVADEIRKHTTDLEEALKKNKPSTGI